MFWEEWHSSMFRDRNHLGANRGYFCDGYLRTSPQCWTLRNLVQCVQFDDVNLSNILKKLAREMTSFPLLTIKSNLFKRNLTPIALTEKGLHRLTLGISVNWNSSREWISTRHRKMSHNTTAQLGEVVYFICHSMSQANTMSG